MQAILTESEWEEFQRLRAAEPTHLKDAKFATGFFVLRDAVVATFGDDDPKVMQMWLLYDRLILEELDRQKQRGNSGPEYPTAEEAQARKEQR